jgi:hypothetical protein
MSFKLYVAYVNVQADQEYVQNHLFWCSCVMYVCDVFLSTTLFPVLIVSGVPMIFFWGGFNKFSSVENRGQREWGLVAVDPSQGFRSICK